MSEHMGNQEAGKLNGQDQLARMEKKLDDLLVLVDALGEVQGELVEAVHDLGVDYGDGYGVEN